MRKFSKYEEMIFDVWMSIEFYFKENPGVTKVPVNVLLPKLKLDLFLETGKERTSLEELLDEMNARDHINMLPHALGEDNPNGLKWNFIFLKGASLQELEEKMFDEKNSEFEELGDENYLIDLCDEILEQRALRQHYFELRWSGRNFPVVAYYPTLKLALFYRKIPQSPVVTHLETLSWVSSCSVHREREKEKFLVNSRELLAQKGIQLLEIDHSEFNYNKSRHLLKQNSQDSLNLRRILNRTFDEPRFLRNQDKNTKG